MRAMTPNVWRHSLDHDQPCQVISTETLWGEEVCRVWLPRLNAVARLAASRLLPLTDVDAPTLHQLCYVASAARIVDALEHDALVAPLEGTVIPLPHQLYALQRTMANDRVRYLLADEVGLGKTIEAGLVLRELKVRGLVKRILVVAPTGLVTQWVSELKTHFQEDFRLVIPGHFGAWRMVTGADERDNLWRLHDQVVCPLDGVKPMESRRGWSREQVERYNRERFEDLVTAGWDLIIIDEAHRLGGSTEQVARFKLGQALAQTAPYLLLLSATPHQGKTEAFRRLIGFLDADALPDDESVRRENVAPYVIRTEKRHAIDADGNRLFKPRVTRLVSVAWDTSQHEQRALYEAVTEYVRDGYNRALREKKTAIGFLMILMQRLVTSSTAAIRTALERRLEILKQPAEQLELFPDRPDEDWLELDGQEQLEAALEARIKGLKNERAEVELLLSTARRCEARAPDGKALALLEQIQTLQREENDPALKVLVFTEFVPTQAMLADFLGQRGYFVVRLNGSLDLEERKAVQRAFADEAQVLISTDAGGEGLNLQFCHVVINYDLPWNPMKLEQRIGRVDRIGQSHVVRALNFALEDTVELRVREVLEEKLERILEEFGVDKLADVLDSEEGGVDFERLYVGAVLSPDEAEARASALADAVRERAAASLAGAQVLGSGTSLDPASAQRVASHQMPFWTERMTLSWLRAQAHRGAGVERHARGYRLRWPDGTEAIDVAFSREEAASLASTHLTLEEPRIRALLDGLAGAAPGESIASIRVPGVSDKVSGWWSLWRIAVQTGTGGEKRVIPLFIDDAGRPLGPTARVVWDRLIAGNYELGIRNYELGIRKYELKTTGRGACEEGGDDRSTGCRIAGGGSGRAERILEEGLEWVNEELGIGNYELRIANYELRTEDSWSEGRPGGRDINTGDGQMTGGRGSLVWPDGAVPGPLDMNRLRHVAQEQGRQVYQELLDRHRPRIRRDEARGSAAFTSRRRAIERIGLPQVRNYRLARLDAEEADWRRRLELEATALPELTLLQIVRVLPEDDRL